MKYKKVQALIVGFVFSVSTMTACGVYGSVEAPAYEPAYTEVPAVYGGPETEPEEMDPYNYNDKEEYIAEDDAMQLLRLKGHEFSIPELFEETAAEENLHVYSTPDGYEHPAELTFITGSYEEYLNPADKTVIEYPVDFEYRCDNLIVSMIEKMEEEGEGDIRSFGPEDEFERSEEYCVLYSMNIGSDAEHIYFCGILLANDGNTFTLVRIRQDASDSVGYRASMIRILETADTYYEE